MFYFLFFLNFKIFNSYMRSQTFLKQLAQSLQHKWDLCDHLSEAAVITPYHTHCSLSIRDFVPEASLVV